jgi:plastocyanin
MQHRRRPQRTVSWLMPPAAAFVLAVAGTSSAVSAMPDTVAPGTHVVTIENMRFNPQSLTVRKGDRIVWLNNDLVPHTATAKNAAKNHAFDSRSIAPQATWTLVAALPGTYVYVCSYHPAMTGTIVVI